MNIGPAQVAVLLNPGFARSEKVPMPCLLGEWKLAALAARPGLSEASTAALSGYLDGEPAHCFAGAFRDGFSYGANWQRRQSEGDHD